MIEIREANTPELIVEAKKLFQEYADSLGFDLSFQNFEQEMHDFPDQYSPPSGSLHVAEYKGQIIGCVAVRYFEKGICEMKRLFVKLKHRGGKSGRKLAEAAVTSGKLLGYERMRLDTLESMKEANKLYASMGFVPIHPYRHNPMEGAIYMELNLKEQTGAANGE